MIDEPGAGESAHRRAFQQSLSTLEHENGVHLRPWLAHARDGTDQRPGAISAIERRILGSCQTDQPGVEPRLAIPGQFVEISTDRVILVGPRDHVDRVVDNFLTYLN